MANLSQNWAKHLRKRTRAPDDSSEPTPTEPNIPTLDRERKRPSDQAVEYEDLIVEQGTGEGESGVYGICLIEKYRDEIRSLANQYTEDMTSDSPFSPEMVDRERARRDEIRDRINKIPKDQRGPDKAEERKRQRRWADELQKHRQQTRPNT